MIKNGYVPNADEVLNAVGSTIPSLWEIFKINHFDNPKNAVFDYFSSNIGVNNTVDLQNTNSLFDSVNNRYVNNLSNAFLNDTTTSTNFTNVDNAFDYDDTTYADYYHADSYNETSVLGKTFNERTVKYIYYHAYGYVYAGTDGSSSHVYIDLQYYDGTNWNTIKSHHIDNGISTTTNEVREFVVFNQSCQGIRVSISTSDTNSSGHIEHRVYTLEYGDSEESHIQTNTLFTSAPKSIFVYVKNTSNYDNITVDVIDDGGQTWKLTDQPLGVIHTDALTGNDIRLRINQKTDGSQTSQVEGYGVVVLEQ